MNADKIAAISQLLPLIAVVVSIAVGGWVINTWLRIKHGYPLDGAWGQAVYPKTSDESMERIKLLSTENAQLRAELGSIKDRLANVERIVTDDSHRLTQEIESLRAPRN
jgi:predicted metal-binding membrane protein